MPFTSFVMFSLRNALGVPPTRLPIDGAILVSYVLPPIVCYFIAAVLAIKLQTRTVQVALWPLVAWLALRSALSVDASLGRNDRKIYDKLFGVLLFLTTTRTLDWALAKGPLVRHPHPTNTSRSTIMDALDLVSNFRYHGWEWSRGLYIPRETRPANRIAFVCCAFLSAIAHTLICGALQRAIATLIPVSVGVGSVPKGSTIFNDSLPLQVRYFRASIISISTAFVIYASIQMVYDLLTIPAILILGQDATQWPPMFDAPWRATSVSDFWGRRWHQMFRRTFLFLGGYPLSIVLGRTGIITGSFLGSAVYHHVTLMTLDGQTEFWWMLVGFGMMAFGILAEQAFYQLTGKRVGGMLGWIWAMAWLTLWGNMIVEGYARAGMFGSMDFVDGVLPVRIPVEHLVANFDVWLHTI